MEEVLKGLAQLGAAGLMSAANIWVLWYLLTKMMPKMVDAQNDALAKQQDAFRVALTAQRDLSERAITLMEERGSRDEERCERRHAAMMAVLERSGVKLEELSYEMDLIKTAVDGRAKAGDG